MLLQRKTRDRKLAVCSDYIIYIYLINQYKPRTQVFSLNRSCFKPA